jgi:hypothetical protein
LDDLIVGWNKLGEVLADKHKATLRRYIRQGKIPGPRYLSGHVPVWVGRELQDALAALPRDTCEREAE